VDFARSALECDASSHRFHHLFCAFGDSFRIVRESFRGRSTLRKGETVAAATPQPVGIGMRLEFWKFKPYLECEVRALPGETRGGSSSAPFGLPSAFTPLPV
jgi:hypothetical protein